MKDQGIRPAAMVLLLLLSFTLTSNVAAQKKRFVEIEVVASNQAPVETQQRWMKLLTDVGADRVRTKSSTYGAKVKISETETSSSIRIKVEGAIQNEQLILPGKSFKIRDKAELADYIAQLKADGAEVALSEKKAFGLTSKQLVSVNAALSKKLEQSTLGESPADVIRIIRNQLKLPLKIDLTAKRALNGATAINDELIEFSVGTALAAIVRPLGLVMAPKRSGQEIAVHLVDYKSVEEHWPIGWPSSSIPKRMAPSLFDKFPIEVRDFPLDQVLKAIETRSMVPMLFDYNTMARAGIDLQTSNVTFTKKSSYAHALGRVLNQTSPRMDYEIRVDENGKVFLWITTANPVRQP